MAKVLPHFCLALAAFAVATFAFAQDQESRPFESHLRCYRALQGKTSYEYPRTTAGFRDKPGIAIIPDPANDNGWYIYSEAFSTYQTFQAQEIRGQATTRGGDTFTETPLSRYRIQIPGKPAIRLSSSTLTDPRGATFPRLYFDGIESSDPAPAQEIRQLNATPAPDATSRKLINDSLLAEIRTMARTYRKLQDGKWNPEMREYLSALTVCGMVSADLAKAAEAERTQLMTGSSPIEIGPYAAGTGPIRPGN
ncbi:MAG TPA: hypothetical protein VM598_14150 [Bdellovibrionota bacterium]|nr:hypothetical protein [Bdellovibrionota bacterium]